MILDRVEVGFDVQVAPLVSAPGIRIPQQGVASLCSPSSAANQSAIRSASARLPWPPPRPSSRGVSPDPFAPAATIDYHVPAAGRVVLGVSDGLGRRVATLVDEYQPANLQPVTWTPWDLASGVYLVRLAVVSETAAKQIVLLR